MKRIISVVLISISTIRASSSESTSLYSGESCIGLEIIEDEGSIPMCSKAGNDNMIDFENESKDEKSNRLAEFYEYFEVDVNVTLVEDIKIQNKYCNDFSE
jgi:hypothetical protein